MERSQITLDLDRFYPSESFGELHYCTPAAKEFYLDDGFEPTIELCHGQEQGGGR